MTLICALAMACNMERALAAGTIYIRSDGSVEGTDMIIRNGDLYTFTGNVYEPVIVQRDDAIIDGNGYLLQGPGSGTGFGLSNRNNVTLKRTQVNGWNYGISVYNHSSDNLIVNSNFTQNLWQAIFVSNSSDNIIASNMIANNIREGIFLGLTNTTIITGNNVSNNGEDGIFLGLHCLYNTIANNTIAGNRWAGIALCYQFSTGNVITGNNIMNNLLAGIDIADASGNVFQHNNFLYNTDQVTSAVATNVWDNGSSSGGNYWSDYTGVDLSWGSYQNRTGSDGIGDAPHPIDIINQDKYPLMSPYEYWNNPIPGDINRDIKVDNKDLYQLMITYGSTPETPNWNPNSDIDQNNVVSAPDLLILGKNFGKSG